MSLILILAAAAVADIQEAIEEHIRLSNVAKTLPRRPRQYKFN